MTRSCLDTLHVTNEDHTHCTLITYHPSSIKKHLLPQLSEITHNTTVHRQITDVTGLKKLYLKCFDIIGNFEEKYSFVTDPYVPSVEHAQHKVSIKLQETIEAKLDKIVQQGIITPLTESTEWVNSMAYSP